MRKKIALTLIATTALFLSGCLTAMAQEEVSLKNIRISQNENRLEVTLEVPMPVDYESFTLFNPNRLIIDLRNTKTFSCNPSIEVNAMGVKSIRTARNQPDVIRVVFDFVSSVPPYSIRETGSGFSVIFEQMQIQEKAVEQPEVTTVKEEEKVAPPPKPAVKTPPQPRVEKPVIPLKEDHERMLSIGLNSGLYFMQDQDFQDVYGKSALFFGGESSFYHFLSADDAIGVVVDFKSLSAVGKTTYTQEEVKLRIVPLTFSASYLRKFGRFLPYVCLGADYFNYRETYPETFAVSQITGTAWGVNIQLGTYIRILDSLSIKAFFKFHNARTSQNDVDINLGGNEYGVSLSYNFRL